MSSSLIDCERIYTAGTRSAYLQRMRMREEVSEVDGMKKRTNVNLKHHTVDFYFCIVYFFSNFVNHDFFLKMKGVYAVLSTSASLLLVHSKPLPSTTFSSLQITSNLEAIPSCSTYHGKTPTKDPLHFIYYPAGCPFIDLEATIVSPFNWEDGKVMLSFDSSLDESVLELSERKAELVASKMILEMDRPKSGSSESQQRFGIVNNNGPNLISSTKFGELYQFTNDQQLIDFTSNDLYSFTELVAIHSSPLPFPNFHRSTSDVINNNSDNLLNSLSNPVDESSRLKIVDHLKKLKFSNLITTILASLPREQLVKDVEYLTGENQPGATSEDSWHSRHSMSSGGFKASNWMLKELSSFGLNCTQTHYLPGFSPYVTCIILGREAGAGTFVLGAHMDSRGTFGSGVAPGGDDDGSGAAALMSIARHITTYPLTFKRKISKSYISTSLVTLPINPQLPIPVSVFVSVSLDFHLFRRSN